MDFVETRTAAVGDQLTAGQPQRVDDGETATDVFGGDFTDEERRNQGPDTHAETHDQPAGSHLPEAVGRDLEHGTDHEKQVGEHQTRFAAPQVGRGTRDDRGDQGPERRGCSDDFLFAVREDFSVEVCADRHQRTGDVTGVVTEHEPGNGCDEREHDDEGRHFLVERDHHRGVVLVVDGLDLDSVGLV